MVGGSDELEFASLATNDEVSTQLVTEHVESASSTCLVESVQAKPSRLVNDEEHEGSTESQSPADLIITETASQNTSLIAVVESESLSNAVFSAARIVEIIHGFLGDGMDIRQVLLIAQSPAGTAELSQAINGTQENDTGDQFDFMDDEIEVPEERDKDAAEVCDQNLARSAGRGEFPERAFTADVLLRDEEEEFEVPRERRPQKQCGSLRSARGNRPSEFQPDRILITRRETSPDVVDRIGEICVVRKDSRDGKTCIPKRGRAAKARFDARSTTLPEVVLHHCLMRGGMESPVYRIESADIENAARDLDRLKKQFADRRRPSYDQVNVTLSKAAALDDFADLGTECPLAPLECSLTPFSCAPNKCRPMVQ
mmetsp:Transcript_8134/g.13008  ORF Transcript_8134/g.13008 Transcript_8134/m.13008 type:complete len:371 (-) Transcript_8134:79-1191(-)